MYPKENGVNLLKAKTSLKNVLHSRLTNTQQSYNDWNSIERSEIYHHKFWIYLLVNHSHYKRGGAIKNIGKT